jgi:lysophospholipase L1-like esterase
VGTAGIYWRGGPTPLLRQALRGDPRLVTVTIGANDVLAFMAASGRHRLAMRWAGLLWRLPVGRSAMRRRMDTVVRDSAMEATGTRLASLLRYLTAPGRVVVVTTYPVGDGSDELRDSFVGPLNAQIRRAARVGGARLVDLEPLFAGHDRTTGRRDRWISRIDGMHPVARGHARIADAVVAAVLDPPGV